MLKVLRIIGVATILVTSFPATTTNDDVTTVTVTTDQGTTTAFTRERTASDFCTGLFGSCKEPPPSSLRLGGN